MELKTYPKYLYHKDHNEPIRVDSKAEQTDKENLGWTTMRLFKEFPKWIGDKLVRSKAEEDRLFASKQPVEDIPPSIDMSGNLVTGAESIGSDSLFDDIETEIPPVTKETQVEGQDTAKVVEKSKEGNGRRKKK